jgi:hypothetical protein
MRLRTRPANPDHQPKIAKFDLRIRFSQEPPWNDQLIDLEGMRSHLQRSPGWHVRVSGRKTLGQMSVIYHRSLFRYLRRQLRRVDGGWRYRWYRQWWIWRGHEYKSERYEPTTLELTIQVGWRRSDEQLILIMPRSRWLLLRRHVYVTSQANAANNHPDLHLHLMEELGWRKLAPVRIWERQRYPHRRYRQPTGGEDSA